MLQRHYSPSFLRAVRVVSILGSKDDTFKFSHQLPTRKYENTPRGQSGFVTIDILFLPAAP